MSTLVRARVIASGTTANRPASAPVGFQYLDLTLGYPVTVKTNSPMVWVNASGYPV
ncbi:hypothetical protein [Cupriavidus sp. CuC1]|uniref:hypothetical protein n=1 Tax=Cupriavidus sp. CuC1 TaxID=3373131 RepID=UPI0037CDE447